MIVIVLGTLSSAQTLRQEADRAGVLIGTAARAYLLSEAPYAPTLAREYNLIEPEDELKWQALRPDEGTFNFRAGDQLVEFARAHGIKVRGHCLVWGRHNPAWLAGGSYSPRQLRELLHEHIRTVVSHYRGKVFAWDVINEAMDEHGQLRPSVWYDQPGIGEAGRGTAYIEQAFRWTHEADPQALLFYNEAEGEEMNAKSDAIYAMLADFKKRGVPIDGVGLQMHILDMKPDVDGIAANIRRLAALGLQIHITELDVALAVNSDGHPRDPADLQRQAEIYSKVVEACLAQPACTAIQTWGFTDRYSWLRSWTKSAKGAGLPLDGQYAAKPAYFALREALGRRAFTVQAPHQ